MVVGFYLFLIIIFILLLLLCYLLYFCLSFIINRGARCSSKVRVFTGSILHGAISHSSQCLMTGATKAVVCVILSVG